MGKSEIKYKARNIKEAKNMKISLTPCRSLN